MKLLVLFLLLGVAQAAEAPIDPDVTIKQSQLLAMKAYNDTLWDYSARLWIDKTAVEEKLHKLQGAAGVNCGDMKSALWVMSRGG